MPVVAGSVAFNRKGRTVRLLVSVLVMLTGVFIFCGAKPAFLVTLWNVAKRQFTLYMHSGRFNPKFNPFLLAVQMLPALGLVSFCLFLAGIVIFVKDRRSLPAHTGSLLLFSAVLVLPLAIQGVVLSLTAPPFTKGLVLFLPAACLFSGIAFAGLFKYRVAVLLIVLYQIVCVLSVEWFFLSDTREAARDWIRETDVPAKKVYVHRSTGLRDIIKKRSGGVEHRPDYLVLHETEYRQFLPNILDPFRSMKAVSFRRFSLPERWGFYKALFHEKTEYELVRSFAVVPVTPELWLFKKLWGTFPSLLGDLTVFKKPDKQDVLTGGLKLKNVSQEQSAAAGFAAGVTVLNPDPRFARLVALGLTGREDEGASGGIEWKTALVQPRGLKRFTWNLPFKKEPGLVLSLYQKDELWFFNPMNKKFGNKIGVNQYETGTVEGLVMKAVPEDGTGFLVYGPFIPAETR